jgi:hypothetical protein
MDLTPGDIINAGVNVVTVYLLVRVMNRLDTVTDRIFNWLEKADAQRAAMLRAQGINPNDSGIYKREDLGLPPVER